MTGEENNLENALAFLRECGVVVNLFTTDIIHNEEKCVDCGACTSVCPTGAVHIEAPNWELSFETSKCVRCRQCVPACPMRAINIDAFE
jgi:ferredoxin